MQTATKTQEREKNSTNLDLQTFLPVNLKDFFFSYIYLPAGNIFQENENKRT